MSHQVSVRCRASLNTRLEDQDKTRCAECSELARQSTLTPAGSTALSSAKIEMLLKLIRDVDERSKCTEKTIVFSQFTSFLDIIEPFLKSHEISFVRCACPGRHSAPLIADDGKMRNDKRQESLELIKSSASIRVILISFKAGSTGLNLTSCNNVVLMDPWWNPALEDQAFDRTHRLGQQRDVNIYKLCVQETVEDRGLTCASRETLLIPGILALQDQKRQLANAALSGEGAKKLMKLGLNDLMGELRSL